IRDFHVTGVQTCALPISGLRVTALARVNGKTGVEMEALTAASVACLTIYDMAKAVDRGMTITGIRVVEKTGGKSGDYRIKQDQRSEERRVGKECRHR